MTTPAPISRKPVIMVSSAVYGIEELLDQVFGILNGAGFTVWMSHKGTVPVDPAKSNFDNCLAAVDACDMFLGIMTTRYGSGKDGPGDSITHREILRALQLEKPRWFLAHHDLVFLRGLFNDLGYKTTESRAGLKLERRTLVDDLRVIDIYDAVIQAERNLSDRRGNWAQPYSTPRDANVFVVAQFLRYADATEFIKQQPLAALMQADKADGGQGGQQA